MRPKSLLLALLCLLAAFISCDQEEEVPSSPVVHRIKTITYHMAGDSGVESYEYDALGRVSKLTHINGAYDLFEYHTGKIIKRQSYVDDYFLVDTLFLNKQGWVISHRLFISNDYGRITCEYTPEGRPAKVSKFNRFNQLEKVTDYKVSKGNTTAYEEWISNEGKLQLKSAWEQGYLPNSVNTIGAENKGMAFYGKQDVNLVSVIKKTVLLTNDRIEENILYEWDDLQRVVKMKYDFDPETHYITYTYY